MLLYFFLGLLIGGMLIWFLYFSARREIVRIEEDKQLLQQEKHIVIEFMHNLVEAIGGGVDKEDLYQKIVHTAILSSGALSACIFELDEDERLVGRAIEGLFPPQRKLAPEKLEGAERGEISRAQIIENILRSEQFRIGEGIIGSAAQTQKAVLVRDASKDPRIVKHADPALQAHSLIIAPITFRETLLGVLAIANPVDGTLFTDNDLSLVESLAEQAGMAIHNVNLMAVMLDKKRLDFDLSLAKNIQGLLLPPTPKDLELFDVDTIYQPAQQVGGDLYHFHEYENGKLAVAIADVSGKGIPASILMAICQTNLKQFCSQMEDPAEIMKAINANISDEIRDDMFITMTFAIIDPGSGSISLARAGHEAPMVARKDERTRDYTVERIKCAGMALGMAPPEIFDQMIKTEVRPFKRDDVLLLYTDGIIEAADRSGEEFGESKLMESLNKLAKKTSAEINQGVREHVMEYCDDASKLDDLTLVTVKHS